MTFAYSLDNRLAPCSLSVGVIIRSVILMSLAVDHAIASFCRSRLQHFPFASPPTNGRGGRELRGRKGADGRGLSNEVWGRWAGALVAYIFGKEESALIPLDVQSELARARARPGRCFRPPSLLWFRCGRLRGEPTGVDDDLWWSRFVLKESILTSVPLRFLTSNFFFNSVEQ